MSAEGDTAHHAGAWREECKKAADQPGRSHYSEGHWQIHFWASWVEDTSKEHEGTILNGRDAIRYSKWKARRGTCGLGQSYHTDAPACLGGVAQTLTWGDMLWHQQSVEFHKFALQYMLKPAAARNGMLRMGKASAQRHILEKMEARTAFFSAGHILGSSPSLVSLGKQKSKEMAQAYLPTVASVLMGFSSSSALR